MAPADARAPAGGPELRGAENDALLSGVKPSLRIRVRRADTEALERSYREAGFEVRRLGKLALPWARDDTLYVARTSATATRMRELEIALTVDAPFRTARGVRAQRELGELLGYPDCCVEAFSRDFAEQHHPLFAQLVGTASAAYRAARYAWVSDPAPLLNTLLGGERLRIVSFEPCRFDCPHALDQAGRILGVMSRGRPAGAREIEIRLARSIALLASGGRAIVTLERGRSDALGRIASVEPIGPGIGRSPARREVDELRALVGRTANARGVIGGGRFPPILLSFGNARST